MDGVKLNQSHPVISKSNNLSLIFDNSYLPKQNYDSLEINCENESSVIKNSCTIGDNITTCSCLELEPATEYSLSILTNKKDWSPKRINLKTYTTSKESNF